MAIFSRKSMKCAFWEFNYKVLGLLIIILTLISAAESEDTLQMNKRVVDSKNLPVQPLSVLGGIYINPGDFANIKQIKSIGNYLYVTRTDSSGMQKLEAWDVRNPSIPVLAAVQEYGTLTGSPQNYLKFPTLNIFKDIIQVHSNGKESAYYKAIDGSLSKVGAADGTSFYGLADPISPDVILHGEGNFASYYANVGEPYQVPVDQEYQHVIVNFTNPANPFMIRGINQNLSDKITVRTASGALTDNFNGCPAILKTNGNNISMSIYENNLTNHINSFWKPVIEKVFSTDALSKTIRMQIADSIDTPTLEQKLSESINEIITDIGLDNTQTLQQAIISKYSLTTEVKNVISEYGIYADESVKTAIEKIILKQIDSRFEEIFAERFFSFQANNWLKKIIAVEITPNMTPDELKSKIADYLNENLSVANLGVYLISKVFGPFVDTPDWMGWTLNEVVSAVSNTTFGKTMTVIIKTHKEIVTGFGFFESSVEYLGEWYLPKGIPESTYDVLDYALYENGLKLNKDNLAIVEFLKLYAYFNGNKNYLTVDQEITVELQKMNTIIAEKFVEYLQPFMSGLSYYGTIQERISEFTKEIPAREITARAIAEAITARLSAKGIDINQSVRDVLKSYQLYLEPQDLPAGQTHLAQIQDLINTMTNPLGIDDDIVKDIYNEGKDNLYTLQAESRRFFNELIKKSWGDIDLDMSIPRAIEGYISQEMDLAGSLAKSLRKSFNGILSETHSSIFVSYINLVTRAFDGDCIARWELTLRTASYVGDIFAFFTEGLSESFSTSCRLLETALEETYNQAIYKGIDIVLGEVIDKVLEDLFESFNSLVSQVEPQEYTINAASLTTLSPVRIETFTNENKVGMVVRESYDYINPRKVSLVLFDPKNPTETAQEIMLSGWGAVDYVHKTGSIVIVGGQKFVNNVPKTAAMFIGIEDNNFWTYTLIGNQALIPASAEYTELVNHGRHLAMSSPGGLYIMSLPSTYNDDKNNSAPAVAFLKFPADNSKNIGMKKSSPKSDYLPGKEDTLSNPELKWNYAEGATEYDVYFWEDGTPKPSTPITSHYQDCEYKINQALDYGKTYKWQIVARNKNGETDSAISTFATALKPPDKPSLPAPADYASETALRPTFDWNDCAGADSYSIVVWEANADNPYVSASGISQSSWTPSLNLQRGKIYNWYVAASGPGGMTSGDTWIFSTIPDVPQKPASPAPYNGAVSIPLDIEFYWNHNGQTTGYDIYIWTSGESKPDTPTASNLTKATFTYPTVLLNNTIYYWQIRAKNSAGTNNGDVWSFTTEEISLPGIPGSPSGAIPADAAKDLPITTNLNWSDSLNAQNYDVYFWKMNETKPAEPFKSNLTSSECAIGYNLEYDTWYLWQVVAKNGIGIRTGKQWGFRTEKAPEGLLPGEIGNPVPTDLSYNVLPSTSFSWGFSARADYYEIKVWNMDDTSDDNLLTSTGITMTSWKPVTALLPDSDYRWMITTYNSYGFTSGPLWKFYTAGSESVMADGMMYLPQNPIPSSGSANFAPDGTLDWDDSFGAENYDIYIWKKGSSKPLSPIFTGLTQSSLTFTKNTVKPSSSGKSASFTLENNTTYYWQIVAINSGMNSFGPVWQFTTEALPVDYDIWMMY